MEIKFKAKVKEVSIKNLASSDKGLQMEFRSGDIIEAMKLAQLKPEELVKVKFRKDYLFATVHTIKKTNFKKEDLNRAEFTLEAAPAELIKVAGLGIVPLGEEVEIEYNIGRNNSGGTSLGVGKGFS